jgi:protein O-GlcNAc transferase
MGASFAPYMLLDPFASPPNARDALSERLVLAPHCYQVNDHARRSDAHRAQASPEAATTALDDTFAYGLTTAAAAADVPALGFTGRTLRRRRVRLVNFNQLYKVSPTAAEQWCAMLHRSPLTDLWLLALPADGESHLRAEFAACGIDHRRRVKFAPLLPEIKDHLQRTSQAHLLVDTLEYSSHTTGSDALWGGVPMLTLPGETMAARVGWSLLRAAGVPAGKASELREATDTAVALSMGA